MFSSLTLRECVSSLLPSTSEPIQLLARRVFNEIATVAVTSNVTSASTHVTALNATGWSGRAGVDSDSNRRSQRRLLHFAAINTTVFGSKSDVSAVSRGQVSFKDKLKALISRSGALSTPADERFIDPVHLSAAPQKPGQQPSSQNLAVNWLHVNNQFQEVPIATLMATVHSRATTYRICVT